MLGDSREIPFKIFPNESKRLRSNSQTLARAPNSSCFACEKIIPTNIQYSQGIFSLYSRLDFLPLEFNGDCCLFIQ
jgi:hypothetical protein